MEKIKEWNYKKIKKIRETGIIGKVYLCRDLKTGKKVAITLVHFQCSSHRVIMTEIKNMVVFIRRVNFLKQFSHDNIVRLLDIKESGMYVYLVFEYVKHNLLSYINHPKFTRNPIIIKAILKQILAGLAYCHSKGKLHKDLKPFNVLLDLKTNMVKLADIGLAGAYEECAGKIVGSFYDAPEILLGSREYSKATDIWAVGCMFGEMVTGGTLFPFYNKMHQLSLIFRLMGTPTEKTWPGVTSLNEKCTMLPRFKAGCFDDEFYNLEPAGRDLLSRMLCLNPRQRITATKALEHEYLQGVENVSLIENKKLSSMLSTIQKYVKRVF